MTSNLGSEFIQPESSDESVDERVMASVRAHFRPEFLNRIDDIIVFRRLTRDELRRIVDLQLGLVAERLSARDLALDVTPEARELLAEEGFDPVYGARPLKRVIQKRLVDPLATLLLEGRISKAVLVDTEGGEFVLREA